MKNTVKASIEFSFKGKTYSPSVTLDLDEYLQSNKGLPNLYALIATKNNFDLYSYEYEMMQAEIIKFSAATGLAKNFITNGELDIKAFKTTWKENFILSKLLIISEKHLGIENFTQHPELEKALLEAYQLGKQNFS